MLGFSMQTMAATHSFKKTIPLQDTRELVSVAHQSATLAVLLLLRGHNVEVRRLHRSIPGIEWSTSDERVVQGVA